MLYHIIFAVWPACRERAPVLEGRGARRAHVAVPPGACMYVIRCYMYVSDKTNIKVIFKSLKSGALFFPRIPLFGSPLGDGDG